MSDDFAPGARLRHGGLGISSFVVALAAAVVGFAALAAAGYLKVTHQASTGSDIIVGSTLFLGLFMELVAVVLGIVGLFDRMTKRTFAVLGLCFAVAGFVLFVGVIAIGLMRLHGHVL
jgi:hypothetical protein